MPLGNTKEDAAGQRQKHMAQHAECTRQWLKKNNVCLKLSGKRKEVKLQGNQAGKLKYKEKCAFQLHHKQGIYGVFQNRGQAA